MYAFLDFTHFFSVLQNSCWEQHSIFMKHVFVIRCNFLSLSVHVQYFSIRSKKEIDFQLFSPLLLMSLFTLTTTHRPEFLDNITTSAFSSVQSSAERQAAATTSLKVTQSNHRFPVLFRVRSNQDKMIETEVFMCSGKGNYKLNVTRTILDARTSGGSEHL